MDTNGPARGIRQQNVNGLITLTIAFVRSYHGGLAKSLKQFKGTIRFSKIFVYSLHRFWRAPVTGMIPELIKSEFHAGNLVGREQIKLI